MSRLTFSQISINIMEWLKAIHVKSKGAASLHSPASIRGVRHTITGGNDMETLKLNYGECTRGETLNVALKIATDGFTPKECVRSILLSINANPILSSKNSVILLMRSVAVSNKKLKWGARDLRYAKYVESLHTVEEITQKQESVLTTAIKQENLADGYVTGAIKYLDLSKIVRNFCNLLQPI